MQSPARGRRCRKFPRGGGGGVARIAHSRRPPHLGCLEHPLKFRGRFRVRCWRRRGPDRPLHLADRTLYRTLLEAALVPASAPLGAVHTFDTRPGTLDDDGGHDGVRSPWSEW
jgi:hypothetical protein